MIEPDQLAQWLTPEVSERQSAADGRAVRAVRLGRRRAPRANRRRGSAPSTGRGTSSSLPGPGCTSPRTTSHGPTDDWGEIAVPGTWVLQGYGSPVYLNIEMPFDAARAGRARRQPDRRLPAHVQGPRRVAEAAHAPARRIGRLVRDGVGQRRVRRPRQGQPPAVDVRRHRPPAARRQRPGDRGPAVVRRELDRGPGPVVAPRPAPQRRARLGAHDLDRRRRPRPGPRRRQHDRHPDRRRLRRRAARPRAT